MCLSKAAFAKYYGQIVFGMVSVSIMFIRGLINETQRRLDELNELAEITAYLSDTDQRRYWVSLLLSAAGMALVVFGVARECTRGDTQPPVTATNYYNFHLSGWDAVSCRREDTHKFFSVKAVRRNLVVNILPKGGFGPNVIIGRDFNGQINEITYGCDLSNAGSELEYAARIFLSRAESRLRRRGVAPAREGGEEEEGEAAQVHPHS